MHGFFLDGKEISPPREDRTAVKTEQVWNRVNIVDVSHLTDSNYQLLVVPIGKVHAIWWPSRAIWRKVADKPEVDWHDVVADGTRLGDGVQVPDPDDIAFLPTDSPEGRDYLRWMEFALSFAFRNREVLVSAMKDAFVAEFPKVTFEKTINIHHNYASLETHFGKALWVHRKGATLASEGTIGIIPGSMGTASFLVRGLGHQLSLNSCSHGAGRKFGRMDFNRTHNTEDALASIEKSMEGVVYRKFKKEVNRKGKETGMMDVAESPAAYKDVEEVLRNEADLVEPLVKVRPIIVLKG